MVSNLDLVSIIFALFNNYLAISAKHLGGSTINVYKNSDGFCIGSALKKLFFMDYGRWNHSVVEKLRTLTVCLLFVSSNVDTRHHSVILFCSCDWIETEKAASTCCIQQSSIDLYVILHEPCHSYCARSSV